MYEDIEICGMWSEIEISKCVYMWDDFITTTFTNCDALSRQDKTKDYCYVYTNNNATNFYGNNETNPKRPWVLNIDFYFKLTNITEVTSHYLSVGTISGQLNDPGN